MDLLSKDERANKWLTNVGLITSNGPNGQNIMAAEWTHYISYAPALISVHIGGDEIGKATAENISATKEFGVNLAAEDQRVLSSIAGGSHGRDVDKIPILKEMGFDFYPAKKIGVLMVKGAATNAECRVANSMQLGDHTAFIGEVVEITSDPSKVPLAYQSGKYYRLGEQLHRPEQGVLDKIEELKKKYSKMKP